MSLRLIFCKDILQILYILQNSYVGKTRFNLSLMYKIITGQNFDKHKKEVINVYQCTDLLSGLFRRLIDQLQTSV